MSNEQTPSVETLTRDIAAHLGPYWHADIHENGTCFVYRASRRFGFRVEFSSSRVGAYPHQRVHVFGYWDPADAPYRSHPDTPTKITVAYDRGAEVIANEITRRLLPVYEAEWAEAQANRFRKKDERKTHAEAIDELAGATGGILFPHWVKSGGGNAVYPRFISGTRMNQIEVDFDNGRPEVSFLVSGITLAQALAVAAVLYPEREVSRA